MQHPPGRDGGGLAPGRWGRWSPLLADSALALALATIALVAATTRSGVAHRPVVVAFALVQTLPIAFRRRWPLGVLAVVAVASAAATLVGGHLLEPLGLLVALYTVAAHCERRVGIEAGLATAAVMAWPLLRDSNYALAATAFKLGFLAVGWMLGAYLGELRARTTRERELETRSAVAEEQARIARELHDVIAHSLSVVLVQAAAARDVFEANSERAREALEAIESSAREALAELRTVLDAVRPLGEGEEGLAPQPDLSRFKELVDRVRVAGLDVTIREEGARVEVPSGIGLAVYRIIQEALTNTIKHAEAGKAEVVLSYRPEELVVEVCDDGGGAVPAGSGSRLDGGGRGLIGMRERVALYGGTLTAAPGSGGGFQVRATFPLRTQRPR